jgi:hypothetical protein
VNRRLKISTLRILGCAHGAHGRRGSCGQPQDATSWPGPPPCANADVAAGADTCRQRVVALTPRVSSVRVRPGVHSAGNEGGDGYRRGGVHVLEQRRIGVGGDLDAGVPGNAETSLSSRVAR